MELHKVFTTQRRLRNLAQLPNLVRDVGLCLEVPPLVLGELEDGTVFIIDGHHRCLSFVLAGKTELSFGDYVLCQADEAKAMFGRITDPAVVRRLLGEPV